MPQFNTRKVTFRAKVGGDGECFQWCDVPEEDMRRILENYDEELELERSLADDMKSDGCNVDVPDRLSTLCPGTVLGFPEPGVEYKFTIIMEREN